MISTGRSDAVEPGRPRILVIDDEEDFIELAQEIFGARGLQVVTARSAEEAESLFEEGPPCGVAIIDYRLPGKNGAEVARRLHAAWPETRIVFLTGDSGAATRIRRQIPSIAACLVKPVEVDSLLNLIGRLLQSN
jgi:CheY-like chemotaxis protein